MMDDEGLVQGIDGPNPGVGELAIDGQDDVQLSRRELTLTEGHYLASSVCVLSPPHARLLCNINRAHVLVIIAVISSQAKT